MMCVWPSGGSMIWVAEYRSFASISLLHIMYKVLPFRPHFIPLPGLLDLVYFTCPVWSSVSHFTAAARCPGRQLPHAGLACLLALVTDLSSMSRAPRLLASSSRTACIFMAPMHGFSNSTPSEPSLFPSTFALDVHSSS
jgi:hypothetical protein